MLVANNGFPAGFDGAVTGAVAGDHVSYEARIPPNDPNEALRGKNVTFEIQVDGVSERHLPDLDDEFARSVGPFESVDGLRERITGALGERKTHEAQHELEEQAVQALIQCTTFEIADVLVEREREQVLSERTEALVSRGVPVDTYLAMQGQTRDAWQEEADGEALNRIHRGLALDAYADAHDITADEDEMQAEVDRVAEFYPQDRRTIIRTNLMRDEARGRVAATIRSRKALRALVAAVTDGAAPLHDHDHHHPEPSPELAAAAEPEDGPEPAQA